MSFLLPRVRLRSASARTARVGARRIAAFALLFVACASPERELPDGFQSCTEPRPQACTRDYRPVCGHRCPQPPCLEALRRSYGNACDACADPAVSGSTPGRCEGSDPAEPPLLR